MEEHSFEQQIFNELSSALNDLQAEAKLNENSILVIGTSTSEVIGKHIGTSGTEQIAEALFLALQAFQEKTGVNLAFQCCEHLNRALVIEEDVQRKYQLEQVSVIPVAAAGGSMAAYAYKQFRKPSVVEFIKADAGIDVGDTLIGMHLKHVAVPIRSQIKAIGQAHLTLAKTRPKLIGGARAVYKVVDDEAKCK